MKIVKTTLKNFIGTNYDIGQQIGKWVLSRPDILQKVILPKGAFPKHKLAEISDLLDRYLVGVNEEIQGFADTIKISREQAVFYAETYLERGCSLMAALEGRTYNNHTLMARNYDFNDDMEEMCFAYTKIKGKYAHIGSTLNLFGRCDGMNEHGLAVCKASNGLPVGNFEGGQKALVTGFSFWIVVRSILESCKTVEDAIHYAMDAPISYNMNLMLADKNNKIALLQCIDGHKAYRILDSTTEENYLAAANHAVLPEIKPYEKMLIENSVIRYNAIKDMFSKNKNVSVEDLKEILSTAYPKGLCCHYYPEFFGTLRSMIFDTTDELITMTFGSPRANEWRKFKVEKLEEQEISVKLPVEKAGRDFYNIK